MILADYARQLNVRGHKSQYPAPFDLSYDRNFTPFVGIKPWKDLQNHRIIYA